MEKVEKGKGKEVIGQLKELPKTEKDHSKERMETLRVNILNSVESTIGDSKEFTIYEIMDSLLKVTYSYNKRFLDAQFKNVNEMNVTDSEVVK